jgi:DNA polymerase theta
MIGRAGRTQEQYGEAIIFAQSKHPSEIEDICQLSKQEIPDITTHLRDEGELERFYLQTLAIGLVSGESGIHEFLAKTFGFNEEISDVMNQLINHGLINEENHSVTPLGRAIAGSSISIEEGLEMIKVIQQMQFDLCLNDEIHLLYLCVSPQIAATVKSEFYKSWSVIFEHHKHVIRLITNLDEKKLQKITFLRDARGDEQIDKNLDRQFNRIYVAVIMRELVNETPIQEITKRFNVDRGTIQSLQVQCATFAGQMSKFCEIFGAGLLAATLTRFRQRLNFAARTELLGLIVLPSCSKDIARTLVKCGITSPIELAELSVEAIASLITPQSESGMANPGTEEDYAIAEKILKDAKEYTDSLTRLEVLEEAAMHNLT